MFDVPWNAGSDFFKEWSFVETVFDRYRGLGKRLAVGRRSRVSFRLCSNGIEDVRTAMHLSVCEWRKWEREA